VVLGAPLFLREEGETRMVPGLTGTSEMVVKKEDLVSRLGGVAVDVLSTPRLIQLLESAALEAIKEFVPPDQLSLGAWVSVKHLAATPAGMKVTAHALLKGVEKNRLFFLVDAYDEKEKVAEGEHGRILVPKEDFIQRVGKKQAE
jgi:fluoroacetyl-CoA thioesterase